MGTGLSNVTRGKRHRPYLVLVYGADGVGKTTFAAGAPGALFLGVESGTDQMDVERLPEPKHWTEVNAFIDELLHDEHNHKTLVIDSLDWLEAMLHRHICAEYRVKSIEKAAGGYGKGFTEALETFRLFNNKLTALRDKRGMNIVLICHADIISFNDPQEQEAYHRYELKLHKRVSALYREYVDAVLFANYETLIKEENGRIKALSDGARLLHTERRPGFDAKNRYGLPFMLDLSWSAFDAAARKGEPDNIGAVKKRLDEMVETITNEELKAIVVKTITDAGDRVRLLLEIENRLKIKLATIEE